MGTTINGVYEGGKRMRRVRALHRLEYQLKLSAKPDPKAEKWQKGFILLSDANIERINKEITILKSRI